MVSAHKTNKKLLFFPTDLQKRFVKSIRDIE